MENNRQPLDPGLIPQEGDDFREEQIILSIEQVSVDYDDLLFVLRKAKSIPYVSDYAALLGCYASPTPKGLVAACWASASPGWYHVDIPCVVGNGRHSYQSPTSCQLASRPAVLISSFESMADKVYRGEDGVLRFDSGFYPKSKVEGALRARLEEAYDNRDDRLKKTGRAYTYLDSQYVVDVTRSANFSFAQCQEYEFEGQRFVNIFDRIQNEFVWVRVEPVTYIFDPRDKDEQGRQIALPELCPYAGVPYGSETQRTSSWGDSFAKIFADLRFAVEKTGSQLAPEEYVLGPEFSRVERNAFKLIKGLDRVVIAPRELKIQPSAFPLEEFKWAYIDRGSGLLVISKSKPKSEVALHSIELARLEDMDLVETSATLLRNAAFANGHKFMPHRALLENFADGDFEKLYLNGNDKRWRQLVSKSGLLESNPLNKSNGVESLFKLYYILGGFSLDGNARDEAFEYALAVVNMLAGKVHEEDLERGSYRSAIDGAFSMMHSLFGGLDTRRVGYNPEFAEFFMEYFLADPDFLTSEDDNLDFDMLSAAYENWGKVRDQYPYPNYLVRTTSDNLRLTPELVMISLNGPTLYDGVRDDNERLARLVGRYHYPQYEFNKMQFALEEAREHRDEAILACDKSSAPVEGKMTFELLDKTDELGFVLGNLTNCCQKYGDAAEDCVRLGYVDPRCGFMAFRFGDKIVAQAWVWYDSSTGTVCLDNIEIPRSVLNKLADKEGEYSKPQLLCAISSAAESLAESMGARGIRVEEVTTGRGYNDLVGELRAFPSRKEGLATFMGTSYSDANEEQFILYCRRKDELGARVDAVRERIAAGGRGEEPTQ